ncbi:MAG: hypothetical protein GF411_18525 [Candidatus Lokiarchaeota archaeon]|nr:hypothetical protein [Candidatus Lokiarchaeota archaeon]
MSRIPTNRSLNSNRTRIGYARQRPESKSEDEPERKYFEQRSITTDPNPENLSREEILELVKFCPLCGVEWPEGGYVCSNKDCGAKVRIEPKAHNWFLFYPKHNGWVFLEPKHR